jgi:hypothetical protein
VREEEAVLRLHSEFASVEVTLDTDANGPRLRIHDLHSGHVGYLDPLELETLAWMAKDDLAPLLDPSATRWKTIESGTVAELAELTGSWDDPPRLH